MSNEIIELNEAALLENACQIIESRKFNATKAINRESTLMNWEMGKFISERILNGNRGQYGQQIVSTLSTQLVVKYGKSFGKRNLDRMVQFYKQFEDFQIVSTLSTQLSWSHIVEILPLKLDDARLYYLTEAAERGFSVRELRNQISRKAFERREIANLELTKESTVPFNVFKDPYILDMFGLKDNHLEADLEEAVLRDIESFLLEFGNGFSFIERQKRMIIGGKDYKLDLLFYNRKVKRLVAVELKIDEFKPSYKSQMELYLNWLDCYERQEGEEAPIGIILCASAQRETVELLKMDKAGIAVAEYWTAMPPKEEFETKIQEIMFEAKERLARKANIETPIENRQIDYFYEDDSED